MSQATSNGALGRASAVMAAGTAVSRALGLLRGMVLVAAIGATGQAADAFAVANKLPNILYMLLAGGVLNAVLVPQVVRAYKRHDGQEYVDRLLTLGYVILGGVTVVLMAVAPVLVGIYSNSKNTDQYALAVTFAYWCLPQLFFYGVSALLGQVLNARGSFGPYMWAPVVNNLVSLAGFGVFIAVFGNARETDVNLAATWSPGQIALLAGSATLGVIAQAAVLYPAMRHAGVRTRLRWGVRGYGLGRAGTMAWWTFVGLAVGQLGYIVVSRVVNEAPSAAGAGTTVAGNAIYDYAFLVFILPHSLVTVSLATALFTRLSSQAHDGDVDAARSTFSLGMRVVGLFTILATAVIVVLGYQVSRLIIVTGTPAEARALTGAVVTMILGLPFYGAWSMCQRVYYAYEDPKGMVPIQIAMAVVVPLGTLLAQQVLDPRWWVAGAGAAMSLSYAVGAFAAIWHLRARLVHVDGPRVLRTHLQALLGAVFAAGVGAAVLALLGLSDKALGNLVTCVVVGTLMCAAYGLALKAMHVRELDDLLRPLLARVRRRR
ncbi:murein biosynthesis integral membrane protein MurJ [Cellulomonas soli]|uniref:murein biosynthesis integral membrane protein MurJ n=1 Tax=Cellulomonas soli TaxID=931535 RepID=UPI003F83FF11